MEVVSEEKKEIEKCFEKFLIKIDPSFKRFAEFIYEITLIRDRKMVEEVKSLLKNKL